MERTVMRRCCVARRGRRVGDRPQLAGCASFRNAAIAQLNPDSFVTNNGSQMQHTCMHFLLDLISLHDEYLLAQER